MCKHAVVSALAIFPTSAATKLRAQILCGARSPMSNARELAGELWTDVLEPMYWDYVVEKKDPTPLFATLKTAVDALEAAMMFVGNTAACRHAAACIEKLRTSLYPVLEKWSDESDFASFEEMYWAQVDDIASLYSKHLNPPTAPVVAPVRTEEQKKMTNLTQCVSDVQVSLDLVKKHVSRHPRGNVLGAFADLQGALYKLELALVGVRLPHEVLDVVHAHVVKVHTLVNTWLQKWRSDANENDKQQIKSALDTHIENFSTIHDALPTPETELSIGQLRALGV